MVQLSSEEKEELLRLSWSEQLKHDFRSMRQNRQRHLTNAGAVDVDSYIAFVTAANAFANHSMKVFRKIQGDNFKL
jgi:hypothetical protein